MNRRKLVINRDVVRRLTRSEAERVWGGTVAETRCPCTYSDYCPGTDTCDGGCLSWTNCGGPTGCYSECIPTDCC